MDSQKIDPRVDIVNVKSWSDPYDDDVNMPGGRIMFHHHLVPDHIKW